LYAYTLLLFETHAVFPVLSESSSCCR